MIIIGSCSHKLNRYLTFWGGKNLVPILKGMSSRQEVVKPAKNKIIEPPHDKTNKMACAPSEDSDQPGQPPSLIRIFAVCMKKAWVLSYPMSAQRRLWSDWADAQADLSLRWVHSLFVGFVVRRLIYFHNIYMYHKNTKHTVYRHQKKNWCNYLITWTMVYGVVCSGLTLLSTIFQSYHDAVWLRQGAHNAPS